MRISQFRETVTAASKGTPGSPSRRNNTGVAKLHRQHKRQEAEERQAAYIAAGRPGTGPETLARWERALFDTFSGRPTGPVGRKLREGLV